MKCDSSGARPIADLGDADASDDQLTLSTCVNVEVPGQHGLHPFWLANELWRLEPERAFSTVVLPGPEHHWPATRRYYYLHERKDRARAYELILREGSPSDLLDFIDGVLLVEIWKDLDLPGPIRHAWQPLIRKALATSRRRPVPRSERDGPPGALLSLRPSQRSHYLRLGQDVSDDDRNR